MGVESGKNVAQDGGPAKKGRILVVDDDPGICGLLGEALARDGFVVSSCMSGKEALELLEGETFEGVVSDLQMPGLSGLDLLAEVLEEYPHLAFLIVTGQADIRVGIQAMKQGAADYLVKPFQLDAVVASVQRALEMKRLQVELENHRRHLEEMVEQRTKQLQAAMRRIERTYDDTLEALGAALDLRDNETAGHSRRVTHYCLEIAKTWGCSRGQMKQIARGAYLHDMGKIGIPDAILLKPGTLTAEERDVMEAHVRIGYELVSRVAFLASAAEMVLAHQERYDGTGYPQGLVGKEIPLGARIFAVADTLDAMTSDRPYRRALPFSAARKEVRRESGRQFDPEAVRIFLSVPEKVWEEIRREASASRRKAGPFSSDKTAPEVESLESPMN